MPLVSLCKYTCKHAPYGFAHKFKIPVFIQSVSRLMAMPCAVFWSPFLSWDWMDKHSHRWEHLILSKVYAVSVAFTNIQFKFETSLG